MAVQDEASRYLEGRERSGECQTRLQCQVLQMLWSMTLGRPLEVRVQGSPVYTAHTLRLLPNARVTRTSAVGAYTAECYGHPPEHCPVRQFPDDGTRQLCAVHSSRQ